jgi:predicted adenylyl cyclase CyaB
MMEIEKKFQLSTEQKKRLLDSAEFISEKTITDTYYDKHTHDLTKQDCWLRCRNGKYELKIGAKNYDKRAIQKYTELETEEEIRNFLVLPPVGSFEEDLSANQFVPFMSCVTTRTKYHKDGFTIDLDDVDFDSDFDYQLAEIELLIPDGANEHEAIQKILNFAKKHGLSDEPVRGKVIEYLAEKRPKHYQDLLKTGAIQE